MAVYPIGRLLMAERYATSAANTFCCVHRAEPAGKHTNCLCGACGNASAAANAFLAVDLCFSAFHIQARHSNRPPKHKHGCAGCAPVPEKAYRAFLFSAPGVVTITFSGVMISAPLAVAAPLNIFSTIALKVSTILPSVTYSALPLI